MSGNAGAPGAGTATATADEGPLVLRRRGARRPKIRYAAALLALLVAACGEEAPPAQVAATEVAKDLAQVRIEPGLWERSTTIVDVRAQSAPREMVSRMKQRRVAARYCITPEQAARPDANFMAAREGSACASSSFAMRGGRMSGEMACGDPKSAARWTARMQGSYAATGYELEMVMEMANPWAPGPMLITSRVEGRRVGPCGTPAKDQGGPEARGPEGRRS